MALYLLRRSRRIRQGDVIEGLVHVRLKSAGRVHGGEAACAQEGRSLLHPKRASFRHFHDVVLHHVFPQTPEQPSDRVQQLTGRRMVALHVVQHFLRRAFGIDEFRSLDKRQMVLAQILIGESQQVVERRGDHLVGQQLLAVEFCADAEVAARTR